MMGDGIELEVSALFKGSDDNMSDRRRQRVYLTLTSYGTVGGKRREVCRGIPRSYADVERAIESM